MTTPSTSRFPKNRLSQRLTLLFILIATVPLIFGGVFAVTLGNIFGEEEVTHRQKMFVTLGQTLIEQYLDSILNDLHSAGLLALHDSEHIDITLAALCAKSPTLYLEISVADTDGNELSRLHNCIAVPHATLEQRTEYEPFFRANRGEIYIGDVSFLTNNEPIVRLSRPVSINEHTVIVMAHVNLQQLWAPLDRLSAGEGSYFYLVDRRGNLAAYRDLTLVREGRSLNTFPTVFHLMQDTGSVITARYRGLLGTEVVGSSARIKQTHWGIVIEQPRAQAFAVQQRLVLGFILLVAAAGAIGVEIALARARDIVRPIQRLARGAEAIAQGDFSHTLPVTSDDEVGAVAEAFNVMVVRLRELIENLQKRVKELTLLHAVAQAGVESATVETLLERVVTIVEGIYRPAKFGAMLYDAVADRLYVPVPHLLPEGLAPPVLAPGEGVTGQVFLTGQARRIADTQLEADYLPLVATTRSELCVPLKVGTQCLGVLNAESDIPNAFSEDDERLLTIVAGQVATALARLEATTAEARRVRQLAALYDVGKRITSILDLDTLLNEIVRLAAQALHAYNIEVALLEDELLTFRAGYGGYVDTGFLAGVTMSLDTGLMGYVARTGQALLAPDVTKVPEYIPYAPLPDVWAELAVPLQVQGQIIGVFDIKSDQPNGIDEADVAIIEILADQVAVAIQNARLFAESQQHAEELAAALEQLKELDKMKNEFIQNVSHELRTPLAIVRGYAELLADGQIEPLQPAQQDAMQIVVRRTRMLTEMVEDITLILGAETRTLELLPLSVAEIAHASVAEFRATTDRAGLYLESDIAPDLPLVRGAHIHLRRVLDNLIGNAIKFTSEGGIISVRVWSETTQVFIEVSDTGIGIAPEQQERIFQRFYQVDGSSRRRYGGVGLGLALVKEIAELHAGSISVRSAPGKGSTFMITLPAFADNTPQTPGV